MERKDILELAMKKYIKIIAIFLLFGAMTYKAAAHTITIDGNFDDWTDNDVIATDKAFDYANVMNGAWATHETPFDYVRLYGTYDSTNLYIGIQIVDVIDIADPANAGSSHGTPPYVMNLPQWIAIDTIDGAGYSGVTADGKDAGEYDMWHKGQLFNGPNKPDYMVYFASNFWQGPFLCPYTVNGVSGWNPDANTKGPADGLKGASGPGSMGPIIGNAPDYATGGNSKFDYIAAGHDRSRDSFFEIAIPLSLIGNPDPNSIRVFVGQGDGDMASGVDSIPDDTATLDLEGVETWNSPLEWADVDIFTAPFASLTGQPAPQGYTLTCKISSALSITYSDVIVFANSDTAIPDSNGSASFTNLSAGNYAVTAALQGYLSDSKTVDLNANTGDVLITLSQIVEGDINKDKIVDGSDLMALAFIFGQNSSSTLFNTSADLNSDNIIDGNDLMILAQNFGKHAE